MLKELPEAVVLLGLSDPEDTFLGHQEAYFTESPFPAEALYGSVTLRGSKKPRKVCVLYISPHADAPGSNVAIPSERRHCSASNRRGCIL